MTILNKLKAFFSGKRVIILGFGLEGKSTFKIIKDFPLEIIICDKNLVITDEIKDYKHSAGENYLDILKNTDEYDIIMKSPGIALFDDFSDEVKAKITSQTDLFLQFSQHKIIGVTGTKGKSTTSSLIHHYLKYSGKDSHLIGNIGLPPLECIEDLKDDSIIVFEMSCHQLEYVKASPNIAVLLNIYEEHLDHYTDFFAYKKAKENIYRYQKENDILIFNAEEKILPQDLKIHKGKKITAGINYNSKFNISTTEESIFINEIEISKKDLNLKLFGRHNLYNAAVAIFVALEVGCKLDELLSLPEFRGLPHRLEYVGKFHGVEYINDSISTIPNAAINALKAFPKTDTLILGGMDRGISYDILTDYLNENPVKNLILLPDSGGRIKQNLTQYNGNIFDATNMETAVKIAKTEAKTRVILSPAAASYGFYKNFEERGDHFKSLVKDD